jgi:hypothetical protein
MKNRTILAVDNYAHRVMNFHLYSYSLNVESKPFVYGDFVVLYHEERLYSVRHRKTDVVSLVFANNPNDAIMRVKEALKERENNDKTDD